MRAPGRAARAGLPRRPTGADPPSLPPRGGPPPDGRRGDDVARPREQAWDRQCLPIIDQLKRVRLRRLRAKKVTAP